MSKPFIFHNWFDFDPNGNPAGGTSYATGDKTGDVLSVVWQNGPIKDGEQNGVTVEDMIEVVVKRLQFFQNSRLKCQYNENALMHLQAALFELEQRTQDRVKRGVEGTHQE